jgi:hypothetical protein
MTFEFYGKPSYSELSQPWKADKIGLVCGRADLLLNAGSLLRPRTVYMISRASSPKRAHSHIVNYVSFQQL